MNNYYLRRIEQNDLKKIFEKMESDFLPSERAPFFQIKRKLKQGVFEGYILVYNQNDVGYCINALSQDRKNVLISYLAVDKNLRKKRFRNNITRTYKRKIH